MGALKALLIIISCVILVLGMTAADVTARIEGRWILQAGDVIAGEDISIQKPQATIFHQQTASINDLEHLDINFPVFGDGVVLGPTTGEAVVPGGTSVGTANVLPFGPVNLAFPSVHEDVTQAVDTSSTGFFKANWAYIADTATANLGSEPLGTSLASGHPFKSNKILGSEFIWPLMVPVTKATASGGSLMLDVSDLAVGNNIPGMDGLQNEPIESILLNKPVYHTPKISFSTQGVPSYGNNTSAMNNTNIQVNNTAVMNNTSQSRNASQAKTPSRKPRVNLKSTKAEVKNMTTLPRVYRNAFVGTTMHKAFEGPVTYPVWIDPFDNGAGVFNQIDMQKIIQNSLKKTLPGERIAPVFWDL